MENQVKIGDIDSKEMIVEPVIINKEELSKKLSELLGEGYCRYKTGSKLYEVEKKNSLHDYLEGLYNRPIRRKDVVQLVTELQVRKPRKEKKEVNKIPEFKYLLH